MYLFLPYSNTLLHYLTSGVRPPPCKGQLQGSYECPLYEEIPLHYSQNHSRITSADLVASFSVHVPLARTHFHIWIIYMYIHMVYTRWCDVKNNPDPIKPRELTTNMLCNQP